MMVLMALGTTALAAPFLPKAPACPDELADQPAPSAARRYAPPAAMSGNPW
jgi:hypothetical protein